MIVQGDGESVIDNLKDASRKLPRPCLRHGRGFIPDLTCWK